MGNESMLYLPNICCLITCLCGRLRRPQAFHGKLPGFDGFRESGRDSGIVQAVIANDLTKYLSESLNLINSDVCVYLHTDF